MFGIKQLVDRIRTLEQKEFFRAETPEPTVQIPVVDAKGKTVNAYYYGFPLPKKHTLPLQEAFDALQKAAGVEIQLVKGVSDTVKATKVKRGK